MSTPPIAVDDLHVRSLSEADFDDASTLLYGAYAQAFRDHGYLEPIADAQSASRMLQQVVGRAAANPAVVAERHGRLVGVAVGHQRATGFWLGPVAVSPTAGGGVGGPLVGALLRAALGPIQVRCDAFNARAIGLAARLGFVAGAPGAHLAALGGVRGPGRLVAHADVASRPLAVDDLAALVRFDPTFDLADLEDALQAGSGLGVVGANGALEGFLFGRTDGAAGIVGPGAATSTQLLTILMARLADTLDAHIVRTHVETTDSELLQHAKRLGFRITSATVRLVLAPGAGDAPVPAGDLARIQSVPFDYLAGHEGVQPPMA